MEIRMPQLGESVTEGTIARWLVRPGDRVSRYQPIAEVITDKVTAEVPAPADGVIESLEVAEGQTVPVGTLIARLAAETGSAAGTEAEPAASQGPEGEAGGAPRAVAATPAHGQPHPDGRSVSEGFGSRPVGEGFGSRPMSEGFGAAPGVRYSPSVIRLAQEHGIDLRQIRGTGLGGRVTRRDVERYLEERQAGRAAAPAPALSAGDVPLGTPVGGAVAAPPGTPAGGGMAAPPGAEPGVPAPASPVQAAGAPAPDDGTGVPANGTAILTPPAASAASIPAGAADQRIPVGPVRRRIAERMLQARREQPHAWTMVRADVTGLVALRNSVKEEFRAREGIELTYLPFLIKAVTESLREYPLLNSVWAGDEIVVRREINISIAVATEDALVVPVIKNADRLSITGLAHAIHDLATRVRAGRLTLEDVQGGTFTVNNTGAFGSYLSQPILNYPQAAILTMEAITKEPVVLDNDAIAIRSMVNLCLSLDHRVLDGLICGRFLQAVRRRLEAYQPGQPVV